MENLKILRSIEDAVFELFLWTLLFPITFVDLLLHPLTFLNKMSPEIFVNESLGFQKRMSPISFFVYGVLLPFIILIKNKSYLTKDELASLPGFNDALLLVVIAFAFFPFFWTIIHILANSAEISRTNFRKYFSEQCYVFTPFIAFILWGAFYDVVTKQYSPEEFSDEIVLIILFILIWSFIVQFRLLLRYMGFIKACLVTIVGIAGSVFAFTLLEDLFILTGQKWLS
jgi:hypothetical protein